MPHTHPDCRAANHQLPHPSASAVSSLSVVFGLWLAWLSPRGAIFRDGSTWDLPRTIEESVCGLPLGDKCTLPAVRLRLSGCGRKAAKRGAVKSKSGWTGLARLLCRLVVRWGPVPLFPWLHRHQPVGPLLGQAPACLSPQETNQLQGRCGYRPPMPPAWGYRASPWLTSHDRPRGHTGAGQLGDDPSQEARPQLGVGDSTGAARDATLDAWGQPQTPPAPPPPRKDPMTAAWAGAGVAFICVVFTGESERFLSSYTMASSSESASGLSSCCLSPLYCPSFYGFWVMSLIVLYAPRLPGLCT